MDIANKKEKAIGLFDSGVGGLTVARQIYRGLPGESTVYYGDTAHVPYGPRPPRELIQFADYIVDFLVKKGVKYIIFACHTTSSVALDTISKRYPVPMTGVVQPGARRAMELSANGRIGILATQATVNSQAYQQALAAGGKVKVFAQAAPRLVPLVEAGRLHTGDTREALAAYLQPLVRQGIDTLLLGCTHYPFLTGLIQEILGPGVHLVDPAEATMEQVRESLQTLGLSAGAKRTRHEYYVSGDPEQFRQGAKLFLGYNIPQVQADPAAQELLEID